MSDDSNGSGDEPTTTDESHATEPETEMGSTVRDVEHERTTAPQSPYTGRQVALGVLVLAVGLLVTFAVPLVLA